MEFLQILLALAALLIVMFKPAKENLAYLLMWGGWIFLTLLYVGHCSHSLFSNINL